MKTLFLTRSAADRRRHPSANSDASAKSKSKSKSKATWVREANPSPKKNRVVAKSGSWERHELKGQPSLRVASSRIPAGARVRRGFSTDPAPASPPPCSPPASHSPGRRNGGSPGTLEVIRCRGFQPGAQEARRADGSVQMRLPLGEWILALKTAQEIAADREAASGTRDHPAR